MAKKKDHTGFRNGKMFCFNCGGSQDIPYPVEISIFAAMGKAFVKLHKDCKPTWVQPAVEPEKSIGERINFWLRHGEQGTSSRAMFVVLSGKPIAGWGTDFPYDPSDFKRCHGLLVCIPEWRKDLDKMRGVSPTWNNLIDNWPKLTEMLLEQLETGKANGMYELMKECRAE